MALVPGEVDSSTAHTIGTEIQVRGVGDGLGSVVCRNVLKGSPGRSGSVSSSLPPPITTGSPPPQSPLLPSLQPWQPLPSRSSLSIPRFPAGPLEWEPSGLAGLGLLWSSVGGGDLLPLRSRTPSSHVLGRSARPPGRATAVAAAAEPPARTVSVPGTRVRQGGEETPGEAEGWRYATRTEQLLPTPQPPWCLVHTYLWTYSGSVPGGNAEARLGTPWS